MAKDKVEPSCLCWHCMAKTHVKECRLAKLALQLMEVKAVFLNLKKNKDKDKADATK